MDNLLLLILDGWGWREDANGNAIARARKPNFEKLWKNYPRGLLHASGLAVGLPEGQIGSSEVGHMIIGAGRNVPQLSSVITNAIRTGAFFSNRELRGAVGYAAKNNKTLHLVGLTSDGGVHSYWEHLMAILRLIKQEGLRREQLALHVILDGRDVGPKTGKEYVDRLARELQMLGIGKIATITGRYWIMDRDKRWDRIAKAYKALVGAEGAKTRNPSAAIGDYYFAGKTDEFIEPTIVQDANGPVAPISSGDAVIFYNFRADRARQIVRVLSDPGFNEFSRGPKPDVYLVCMTQYDATLNLPIAFPPESGNGANKFMNLPELLAEQKIPQLRIAESEKYAHVTYFFSGGKEISLPQEERIMIPSPKVSTYDQTPEMSARFITDKLLEHLSKFPFAVCNFANADMVGHTGILDAAVSACEFVDHCLGRILEKVEALDTALMVTADHGNSEKMVSESGEPHTAHTTCPVPIVLWKKGGFQFTLRQDANAGLKDIAPTILELMGLPRPDDWEGKSLIQK